MSIVKVLYEDNHIIAVIKPAGMLTQGDKSGDVSLFDEVKKYLKEKYKKPGNVFLGLVHRLDKPVAGIVLFGKTSKGASRLSEQFREHTIQKTYHGIVMGKMEQSRGELKEKVNKISFFAEGFINKTDEELLEEIKKATKTRTAELSWEVVPMPEASRMLGGEAAGIKSGKYSLLKIMPKTGRFHQIRIQMANMGHPILGDAKYGAQSRSPNHKTNERYYAPMHSNSWQDRNAIALCATAISFKLATEDKIIHPVKSAGEASGVSPEAKQFNRVNLEIPLPAEWADYLR